jgi:hypothetical protein
VEGGKKGRQDFMEVLPRYPLTNYPIPDYSAGLLLTPIEPWSEEGF